jgi:hypothetical protein
MGGWNQWGMRPESDRVWFVKEFETKWAEMSREKALQICGTERRAIAGRDTVGFLELAREFVGKLEG